MFLDRFKAISIKNEAAINLNKKKITGWKICE